MNPVAGANAWAARAGMSAPGYGVPPARAGFSPAGPAPTCAHASPSDCRAGSACHREPVAACGASLSVLKGSRYEYLPEVGSAVGGCA
jgi:hypothetical protein